jgi:hypothetical protein
MGVTSFVSGGRGELGIFVSAQPKPARRKESRRFREKLRITK